jgi:virginiamycin B lyase
MNGRVGVRILLRVAIFAAILAFFFAEANAQTVTVFTACEPSCGVSGIALGSDGSLWFAKSYGFIGRISTAGSVESFPLPAGLSPGGITTGPDGNLWFTASSSGQNFIGRMTVTGVVTEFPIPTPPATGSYLPQITSGPDGALWFTEYSPSKIGRITTGGSITEFTTPTVDCGPMFIASGVDGNLWFTEFLADQIGRITPAGVISEFALPTPSSNPYGITAGPSGNLWFTEQTAGRIGRISTAGVITEFGPFAGVSSLGEISAGPDDNLWFSWAGTQGQFGFGRMTADGSVTLWTTGGHDPFFGYGPVAFATGSDGNLWFTGATESTGPDIIGRINLLNSGASSIPFLDGRGLAALAALLAALGFFALKRI